MRTIESHQQEERVGDSRGFFRAISQDLETYTALGWLLSVRILFKSSEAWTSMYK